MCTVTYLPLNSKGFVLTSNRDEAVFRKPALAPAKYQIDDVSVFFPKDEQAQGTWIATSNNHFTLCLLNGAFQKHISSPPYKRSRGLVLLDFFKYNSALAFVDEYDFKGIEPFTLLILHSVKAVTLYELRWDGRKKHLTTMNTEVPRIWSSATLYDAVTIQERKHWFEQWIGENAYLDEPELILSFHHFGGKGDVQNDLVMNRNEKRTVSITSIIEEAQSKTIVYEDLQNQETKRFRIY